MAIAVVTVLLGVGLVFLSAWLGTGLPVLAIAGLGGSVAAIATLREQAKDTTPVSTFTRVGWIFAAVGVVAASGWGVWESVAAVRETIQ